MRYFPLQTPCCPSFTQVCADFFENLLPVAKSNQFACLAIAAILDWESMSLISIQFINREMPEDKQSIFPNLLLRCGGRKTLSGNLAKALYAFNNLVTLVQKLKGILEQIGFQGMQIDPCFYSSSQSQPPIISSHVDDLGLYAIHFLKVKPPKISDSQACLHQD